MKKLRMGIFGLNRGLGNSTAILLNNIEIVRDTYKRRPDAWYGHETFELVRDWRRIASSRANRTIVVRRPALAK